MDHGTSNKGLYMLFWVQLFYYRHWKGEIRVGRLLFC